MNCDPLTMCPPGVPADTFRNRYGFGLDDLRLLRDTCPPSARVFAIGHELSHPEPAGKLF